MRLKKRFFVIKAATCKLGTLIAKAYKSLNNG